MKVKCIGHFKELGHGAADGGSLIERKGKIGNYKKYKSKILEYLSRGEVFAATPMVVNDYFNPEQIIGSPDALTDGIYEWPGDYEYYIREHNLSIPYEFIQHMINNNWKIKSDIDLESLEFGEYIK